MRVLKSMPTVTLLLQQGHTYTNRVMLSNSATPWVDFTQTIRGCVSPVEKKGAEIEGRLLTCSCALCLCLGFKCLKDKVDILG